jgi:hypothetical protein
LNPSRAAFSSIANYRVAANHPPPAVTTLTRTVARQRVISPGEHGKPSWAVRHQKFFLESAQHQNENIDLEDASKKQEKQTN